MNFPKFTLLIGLPGSGKSYFAKQLKRNKDNVIILSSDSIREELFGNESSQEDNNKVFEEMLTLTIQYLNEGKDVIYDATNVVRKRRISLLQRLPSYVIKECFVVWAPVITCVERDKSRGRTVGMDVIMKFVKIYKPPFFDEGWTHIKYHFSDLTFDTYKYKEKIEFMMEEPHDNPHHTLSISEHCNKCSEIINSYTDSVMFCYAAEWHDCGKPYVKSFTNNKGEPTKDAHYYNHQNVGSYIIPGILKNYRELHITPISWLVNVHMDHYLNTKYYKQLPEFLKKYIDILHYADVSAH